MWQKVAVRTLQLLFLPGALNPSGSTARRNRKHCALKAQLQSAQGIALGYGIRSTIPAPCKGSYIKIEGCNLAIEGCSCPYRAHFLFPYVIPGRCPGNGSCPFGARNTINIYAKHHKYEINGAAFGAQFDIMAAARTPQLLWMRAATTTSFHTFHAAVSPLWEVHEMFSFSHTKVLNIC
jgi:hypothetical protein